MATLLISAKSVDLHKRKFMGSTMMKFATALLRHFEDYILYRISPDRPTSHEK